MRKVTVTVPCSSANLGAGFDVLALALSLVASQADAFRIPFFGGRDKAPPAPREETRAPTLPAATAWPQAASDIAPDPAVRFGTLPNGMRYALQRSASPPGQASIRLRFDAGSMMETDAQQGLAHFLEHMAFNGSTHVPEGEMVKILERLGLSFGADTNASTSFTQTVYKLDLPNVSDETVDTALMLMRETASELTISQEAVDRERGVVLSEERSSDSPAYRVTKARLAFLLDGQLAPNRMPIGQATILQTATRDQIADYYARYYRPDRAVLIMVGDFDPTGARDIAFVPVGLNYDRVLEDRVLLASAATAPGEKPRFTFKVGTFLGFAGRTIFGRLVGSWYRNGYACVSFGRPVSLRDYLIARGLDLRALPPDARRSAVEVLGTSLMQEVGRVVPALPVPLAATALLDANRPLTSFELKGRIQYLIDDLEARGSYVHIPRGDRDYAVEAGLRVLRERKLVTFADGTYAIVPAEEHVLRYYANSLAHLLASNRAEPQAAPDTAPSRALMGS